MHKTILAVDDQPLILKSIEHKFKDTLFTLHLAQGGKEAIEKFNTLAPDLVILDLNMPEVNGFDVLQHIRSSERKEVPVIVMSAEDDEKIIVNSFNIGADDYIQKPVGLNELLVRVRKQLNILNSPISASEQKSEYQKLVKDIVGIVIPCYNEEKRLKADSFTSFVENNRGYHLCFVNDGSKDNTLEVLHQLSKGREDYISVYDCAQNGGKAEAVRQGTLHLLNDPQLDYFGYLDADLSTNFEDFEDLITSISDSDYGIVGGSRISRMGANITKQGSRAIISKTINLIIRTILGMSFQDTQCGAKVMTREIATLVFKEPFYTSWLFDVEIFMRIKKAFGLDKARTLISEEPLKRWIHEDGSKLSMKDSIKIVFQLGQIAWKYK
jgi:CheY-like chemotaxis protein